MADITSQLSACLKDYTDTGKALPPASSKAEAMDKAADMLRDAQLEMPELYPQPIAQHMTIVTCELTDGSDSCDVPSFPDKGKYQPICA